MFWLLVIIGMCIPCWSAKAAECSEDSHCPEDYYCELDAYFCRQCLRCEDFKRNPPLGATTCVKSVVDCEDCFEQKSDGNNYNCGPKTNLKKIPDTESEEIRLPMYSWILLVLIVAVIIGGAALIPLISKATYAPVHISESQIPTSGINDHLESTWSAPPAYNAVFNIPQNVEEEPSPYVKPTAPSVATRESADRQATRPYTPPNYIRGPQLSTIGSVADRLSIHNETEMENSVDGVISVRNPLTDIDVLPAGTVSNLAIEECPSGRGSGTYQPVDADAASERARLAAPVVVVNNNLNVQTVSLNGASIFLPQSSLQSR